MERLQFDGPVVLAILDGVGLAPDGPGNAVSKARTPFLGMASRDYLHIALNASGEAVGLTPGQMGNSEVGHNTMGAGRAIKQGITRVDEAFRLGEVYRTEAWHDAIQRAKSGGTLHFAGIFSDGGVHSDINHLEQMILRAYQEGVRRIRVHAIFDGRDVAPTSAPIYVERFQTFAAGFPDADIKIASGGGRMTTVADRYENDWQVVARGWDMMVMGEAGYYFKSPEEALQTLYRLNPNTQDQYLPAFVITDDADEPVGRIRPGDSLIYFDFRADRAIEIAMAFTYWDFPYFDRHGYTPDDVYFVGMTEYNSDTHVPAHRLVEPIHFTETLGEFLGSRQISQLAISETVKFGHITYYFNGNSYDKQPGENHIEIESYKDPFEERPWMRAAEITDAAIQNLDQYKFVRLNYPGGDMVGHTGNLQATIIAMEAIDLQLARLAAAVNNLNGVLVITADHGNAEELLSPDGAAKTAHTTNLVPCIIYDNTKNRTKYHLADIPNPGLANLAATIATLLGQENLPASWQPSLIRA